MSIVVYIKQGRIEEEISLKEQDFLIVEEKKRI